MDFFFDMKEKQTGRVGELAIHGKKETGSKSRHELLSPITLAITPAQSPFSRVADGMVVEEYPDTRVAPVQRRLARR